MSDWKDLGVVDTIYEEEYDERSSSPSPSLSPSLSSPPLTPLQSRVESWSLATGRITDVLIYVRGTCFHLHKDLLISRSTYLKRQLTELSEITLPLNITAETFTLVADFCYGAHVVITPFNVAPLRTAAELLGMTETKGKRDQNLKQMTETYFCRVITVNRELMMIVFRAALRLLPEAETTAFLVSRCIEALNLTGDWEELDECLDDVINLPAEEFQIVAESMQSRFASHDILYRIVDLYIKDHSSMITEEQKLDICNFIDCDKLSPHYLIHAVQNPRLPLRFIVRAMLIEQLNTRRAIVITATTTNNHHHTGRHRNTGSITLGSILRRDAALREAAQLKAEMDATNSRIRSLEKELAQMKKLLQKSEKGRSLMEKRLSEKSEVLERPRISHKSEKLLLESEEEIRSFLESNTVKDLHDSQMEGRRVVTKSSARSASFHHELRDGNKIERGERGSASFASFRWHIGGERLEGSSLSSPRESPRTKKINGKGLIERLKSTLWVTKSASRCPSDQSKPPSKKIEGNGVIGGDEDVHATKAGAQPHKRSHSLG